MTAAQRQFIWYELTTSDVEAAKKFYADVVGWEPRTSPGPIPYTEWWIGDYPVGGMLPTPDRVKELGAPPTWMGYLGVDDVDAAVAEVTEMGGTVRMPARDIPDVGRFAVVADPQGAAFAVFKSNMPSGPPPAEPRPGEIVWHELYTTDLEAAWPFYQKLCGWKEISSFDMGGEFGPYKIFEGEGGRPKGGMANVAKVHGFPPYWGYYFLVEDIAAAAKRIEAGGGKIMNGPMEVPDGSTIVQAADPQGAVFALNSPKKG